MEKFVPPHKIHITSDDTIIQFVQVVAKSRIQKVDMYRYRYIQSRVRLGAEIDFTEEHLKVQLTNYFKPI